MSRKGVRPSRRAARERKDCFRVGVDELTRRAEAGLDLWTGGPPDGVGRSAGQGGADEEDERGRSPGGG